MIKYRAHRGGLAESLSTAREFSTLKDCLQYVLGKWNERLGKIHCARLDDIEISYYGFDDRVNQELYQVRLNDVTNYKHAFDLIVIGFIYEETE